MTGREVLLLLGGIAVGAIVALFLRYLLTTRADNGSVAVSSAACVGPNQLRIIGQFTPLDGNVLIRLFTHINVDPATSPLTNGATEHNPPASGTSFDLIHTHSAAVPASGTAVVWGQFAKFHAAQVAYQCGSGSGAPFQIGQAVSEPAARSYRAVIGDVAQEAINTTTTPELRQALGRGEVILAFDPLRAAGGEAVWSEETPAGETAHWRLTLRKAEETHVAALELVNGSGPVMIWLCRQWHFFAASLFVADPARAAGLRLPTLEVQPT
jgi:hypothetical protein